AAGGHHRRGHSAARTCPVPYCQMPPPLTLYLPNAFLYNLTQEKLKMKLPLGLAILAAVVTSTSMYAHHSFAAEYDNTHPFKLTGAITKVDWSNPHVYFYIDVEDDKGAVTNWALEMGAPGALKGRGWDRTTLKIGDVVVVDGSPAKDGGHHGNARDVTMAATGKKLGAASSEGQNLPVAPKQ
ncbi:MAG: DUF6152 family protein, partial [Acidobacteriota bacterium]